MAHLEVFTDGGFSFKQKMGSWGFVIVHDDKVVHQDKGAYDYEGVTSQQMEMTAIRKALKFIAEHTHPNQSKITVRLTSDSQYCIKGLTEWHVNWKRNGWVNSSGNQVANLNIWKALLPLAHETFKHVDFQWVKGHNGHYYNEMVDRLCNEALGRNV